jgi:hypothetical protein
VYLKPINAMGVPATANIPSFAAQLTAAGPIIARSPQTIPKTNAKTKNIRSTYFFLRRVALGGADSPNYQCASIFVEKLQIANLLSSPKKQHFSVTARSPIR